MELITASWRCVSGGVHYKHYCNVTMATQVAKAPDSQTEKSLAALDKTRFADGATPVAELRLKLQKEMQDHAAVYRTQESLAEGVVRMTPCS